MALRIFGEREEVRIRTGPDAELRDALLQQRKKLVVNGGFNVNALDGNTHASGVREGAVGDPFNGAVKVTVREDKARVFPAKFEDHGDEMFGSALCDLLAMSAAARKEDDIRRGVDEGGRLFGSVVQHLHQIARKIGVCAEPRYENGCFARELRTFEHHAVAGDEGGDEWNYGKLKGVIRWGEDQSNSVRLEMCLEASASEEKCWFAYSSGTEDLSRVPCVIAQMLQGDEHVAGKC